MAKGRMISKKILRSESLNGLSPGQMWLVVGMILLTDDEGKFPSSLDYLRSVLLANCGRSTSKQVRFKALIEHLLGTFTIFETEDAEGSKCFQFNNFNLYQKLKNSGSVGEEKRREEKRREEGPNGLVNSDKPSVTMIDWAKQIQNWNTLAVEHGLPSIRGRLGLTEARKKSFRARFKDAGGEDQFWIEVKTGIENRRDWCRENRFPALDQVLQSKTFTKLIEGFYNPKPGDEAVPEQSLELENSLLAEIQSKEASRLTDAVFNEEGQS